MASPACFDKVHSCLFDVIEHDGQSDLIESGVWRGGMTIFMRGVVAVRGVENRRVSVADSFENLPILGPSFPLSK